MHNLENGILYGAPLITRPFIAQDPATLIVSQPVLIKPGHYTPPDLGAKLAPDLDLAKGFQTQLDLTSCIRIGDTSISKKSPGVHMFSRRWATVPNERDEPAQIPFQIPGITPTESFESANVTAISIFFSSNLGRVVRLTLTSAGGLALGDTISVGYNKVINSGSGFITSVERHSAPILAIAGNQVTVSSLAIGVNPPILQPLSGISNALNLSGFGIYLFNSVRFSNSVTKNPKSKIVDGVYRYQYFQTEDPSSITLPDPFVILANNGEEVESLTTSTDPTIAEYSKMISDADFVQADYASRSRWENSNIWEVKIPLVYATG